MSKITCKGGIDEINLTQDKVKRLELSDELVKTYLIHDVFYTNKQIEIDFTRLDGQKDTIVLDVLQYAHDTIEQLDSKVNGSMHTEQFTRLKSELDLKFPPIWHEVYIPIPIPINETKPEQEQEQEEKKSKILIAFETVRQQARNLFIDEYKIPHIAIPIQGHLEVLPVNSSAFKNWYRMFIFERDGIVLENQTINDLCSLASAYAASPKYGSQIKLNLRTALNISFGRPEWIYDLVNKDWEFIKITSNGWDIVKDEIIFRRYSNQQAQVYPGRNYEPGVFDEFFKLVNIKADDKDSILLLKCYIISLFIPEIQKVVLMLHGSQGAAKSSLQELIKMLVDPSIVKTLTFPRDLNELIQQLSHNYVTYYDNISIIKAWISDQLCRAVSGSASSKRQLYTDDDDIIRSFKRCIGLNGINLAATKPDLLDRSIIVKLERIEDSKQRTPEDIWKAFDEIKAQLLGYILDILVKVLNYEENDPDKKYKLSRMTEFAKYGEIIARCMGYADNEFIKVYERNRQIQTEEIIEFSQVATCLMYMMFEKYGEANGDFRAQWDGTASLLLGELNAIATVDNGGLNIDTKDKYWPKNGNGVRRRLNELAPTLKQADPSLEISFYKAADKKKTRMIKIRKVASDASDASEDENSRSNLDNFSDATADANTNSDDGQTFASEDIGKNRAQNEVSDARDARDANVRVSMGEGYSQKLENLTDDKNGVVSDRSGRAAFEFECYECKKQKLSYVRGRCKTNDLAEYLKHFVQKHPGKPARPNKASLELNGWKAQGKSWEI